MKEIAETVAHELAKETIQPKALVAGQGPHLTNVNFDQLLQHHAQRSFTSQWYDTLLELQTLVARVGIAMRDQISGRRMLNSINSEDQDWVTHPRVTVLYSSQK